MLDGLIDLIGTGGLGTVFGSIVGSVSKYANQRLELTKNKQEMEHAFKMSQLQFNHDKIMAEQNLLEKEAEGRWKDNEKSWDALVATIQAEASLHSGVSQGVADKRALFRMRLTVGLWCAVFVLIPLYLWVPELVVSEFAIVKQITDALVFTATSAGSMWFGAKAVTSRHQ